MAIIPQQSLFVWEEIEELGDLERLRLVLEHMPDEALMQRLEKERGKGRNDYPVRAMWNSVLAGIIFQHDSIASLRRELSRNGQLRWMCGLEGQVPPEWVYSRFLKTLIRHGEWIGQMFDTLVRDMYELLPAFGKNLAIDSKAIDSYAKRKNANEAADGRRDVDADYGKKVYRGVSKDGTHWEKIVKWLGYKLHVIVDADYELPVAYVVTKASASDIKEAHRMLDELETGRPHVLEKAKALMGDKGYDDSKLIVRCWDDHEIKPVIDMRNMWKDGEQTRLLPGYENVTHDDQGTIYCACPVTGKERPMANGGFEKDRGTLKKRCPARAYGLDCQGREQCPVAQGLRIPLDTDRRRFTPIDRNSYKWESYYKKRTSVERVNGRLDQQLGFEKHTIRGHRKMKVRCGLALCVMLAMALGRIKEKNGEHMRSLVGAA